MQKLCRFGIWGFSILYGIALLLFLVGLFGWLGQARDPLSGLLLIPLGLPWNRLLGGLPEPLLPWLVAVAPLINIGILSGMCRWLHGVAR